MPDPYSIAAEAGPRRLRLVSEVRWCVRSRWGTACTGLTYEEAIARAAERNTGARLLAPGVDPEGICTCGQQKWRCAAEEFASHLRRTGG